ncbi:unnamed protein product [Gongylonema pulchrum]|uniref:Secreted protein n=1 Tax=Gongylonema pulchrum TaxID=637853 RepID=A0A183DBP1_9BILA|nr:unnamed protein product [Gongylonema pulchrum]
MHFSLVASIFQFPLALTVPVCDFRSPVLSSMEHRHLHMHTAMHSIPDGFAAPTMND